ncbi:MAG: tetratricopeptide repeat protein [Flavobacteriales bacterium]|nr:tetratricopeptide repeat protein [Flavobacteriales bacterium]
MLVTNVFATEHYSTILQQGNTSYKTENYEEASKLYTEVLAANYESSALYFNLGNCYYKLNQIPDAILNYEKALKLNLGNSDIKFNLTIANKQITDKLETIPKLFITQWWNSFTQLFNIDTWAWIVILSLLFAVALFALFKLSNTEFTKKTSFYGFLLLLCLTFTAYLSGSKQKQLRENSTEAIIFAPSLTVKSSPATNSQDLFLIHEGTKVSLLETVDDWYKVSIPDGNTGWIPISAAKQI